jgi:hypothetical protein
MEYEAGMLIIQLLPSVRKTIRLKITHVVWTCAQRNIRKTKVTRDTRKQTLSLQQWSQSSFASKLKFTFEINLYA